MTVLACMALVDSCSQWLCAEPGVAELLVQYLHEKPRGGATSIERSACERLQQKSAVAIGRLSYSRDVGLIFVELHCELPKLCSHSTPPSVLESSLCFWRTLYLLRLDFGSLQILLLSYSTTIIFYHELTLLATVLSCRYYCYYSLAAVFSCVALQKWLIGYFVALLFSTFFSLLEIMVCWL